MDMAASVNRIERSMSDDLRTVRCVIFGQKQGPNPSRPVVKIGGFDDRPGWDVAFRSNHLVAVATAKHSAQAHGSNNKECFHGSK